jgi:hypothetical protein
MQELVPCTSVFSRSFSMPCASFSMLDDPGFHRDHGALKIMNLKASAKNSSKLNKFLHSEVNLLIQQDQDGQNNT